MQSKLWTVAALLLAAGVARAEQVISVDTTWTAKDSPHVLQEDVKVASGATLTIEPGATVQLAAGTSLTIAGQLLARGTAQAPIRFTGEPSGGSPARWRSVVFDSSSVGATFQAVDEYVSGSILEHCTFEHATRALMLDGASPYVHACTFRDNRYESTSDPRGGAAMMLTGKAAPRVVGCTFQDNEAVSAEGGAIYAYGSSPVLQDNTFTSNRSTYGGALAATGLYSPVVGNTFTKNHAAFEGGGASFTSSAPAFLSNKVDANYAASDGGGVHVCVDCYPHANPFFIDNTITNNSSLIYVGAAGLGTAFVRVFAHNNIHGNKRTDGTPADFGWFHELAKGYPDWVATPDISRNWWGTTDTAKIEKAILDGNDNKLHGKVSFEPVRTGPVVKPETRVTITTLKIRYFEKDEPMPVFLTLYNPGPERKVTLVLMLQYGDRPPVMYTGKPDFPGATATAAGVTLTLPANSAYFTRLLEGRYAETAAGLKRGTWHATLLDAATGKRIGDTCSARFDLGQGAP